ncbi:MAG TPA: IS110 family transposase [Paludibacter sp.]|nr:IS110 family transposase [Paludibacter sp.]
MSCYDKKEVIARVKKRGCATVKALTSIRRVMQQLTIGKETSAMKKCNTVSFEGQVIYCGIDVHKGSWVVNLRHCHRELAKFSMNPNPEMLAKYLKKNYPGAEYQSTYEAGFSGFWAHRKLCDLGIKNIVINPADVPTSGKERDRKNDTIDSRKLARELENRTLEPLYIPSEENLELRNLVRRETQLTGNITRIKNRIKSHLDFVGLKFKSWSGSSLKIMHADAEKRYDYTLQSMLRELRFLREEKLRVIRDEQKCLKRLKREKIQKHLQSIPGIGFRTGVILQAELWDLLRFKDKNALSSYTGLAPRLVGSGENEVIRSAGNRKKKELHYVLIEAAWRSVSYNVEMRARYGSLLHKGFKPQRAISIIAKRLLYTIRAVWLQEREFVKPVNE